MLKLAVVTTVKNDYCFIKDFINYYKKIGFNKIIIFDDGSSENFIAKIPNDSCVSVVKKYKSYELVGVDWLEKIRDQYHNSFDVRKRFNTYYACKILKYLNPSQSVSIRFEISQFVSKFSIRLGI